VGGIVGDSGDGDVEPTGLEDWQVTILDNDDELPTPDPTVDNDLRIYIEAECLMHPEQPRRIRELVYYAGPLQHIKTQAGGAGGNTGNRTGL
jgi:hypothetical protein